MRLVGVGVAAVSSDSAGSMELRKDFAKLPIQVIAVAFQMSQSYIAGSN